MSGCYASFQFSLAKQLPGTFDLRNMSSLAESEAWEFDGD